mgnify:CR=1 FL=1
MAGVLEGLGVGALGVNVSLGLVELYPIVARLGECTALPLIVKANAGLTILDTEYANEDYAIGLAKDNTALQAALNKALAELKADGTIENEKFCTMCGPKFCAMRTTADLIRLRRENDGK